MNGANLNASAVKLLESLINLPSPTGEEAAVSDLVAEVMTSMGLKVSRQPVSRNRSNLIATTKEPPRVLLCTHLDTVSPHVGFLREGDVVRGRGACDAKGPLVAMIEAAKRLLAEGVYSFGLLFVVGEETRSDGAREAALLDLGSEYVVLGEPTDNRLALAQKGTLVFRVSASGRAGHSACPEEGRSAVHKLLRVLGQLLAVDWGSGPSLGETTLNIGKISGGVGANVYAAEAVAEGIFRVGTSLAEVLETLLGFEESDVQIEVLSSSDPVQLHSVPGFPETVVAFGSDAPYLKPLGKVVMTGPGSIEYAHRPDEQVTLQEIAEAAENYYLLVKKLQS